eukprot:GILI01024454.1.p1 GENE.GILI01024454.1~~GILI01024454.1.p1  ORF type:complete len:363 (-),score=25.24 GILI01024454.1:149-1198(-)
MPSSSRVFGGVATLGVVSAASAFGYRSRMVSQRRGEIFERQHDLDERLMSAANTANKAEAAHKKAVSEMNEMRNVVTTVWEDRRHRYDKTVKDMESYLIAAPESIGVLQGIIHHCKFLESVLPSFVRFDARSHQVNSLLLSLAAGREGLAKVAPDLLTLHSYDPFVTTLSEHAVSTIGLGECPVTMKEVSDSFAFCHKALESAIDDAQKRLVGERVIVPSSPSLPAQALSAFLSNFRLAHSKEIEEGFDRKDTDLRVLYTPADVRAALGYTEQLINGSRHSIKNATTNSPYASPEVIEAVKQFSVWKESALTFMLQQQAQRALDSYVLCIADTLTQQVQEGIPAALSGS